MIRWVAAVSLILVFLGTAFLSVHGRATNTAGPIVDVGSVGCDFTSIQEALDSIPAPRVVRIVDPVHTEAGIRVCGDACIVGNGSEGTILQAATNVEAASSRVFLVEQGGTLVLSGVTLRHGRPTECPRGGGAILNRGTTWLFHDVLRDNGGQCGGAVVNEGQFYAFDCTFLGNMATGGRTDDGYAARGSGGALKNVEGYAFLSGCTIAANTSRKRGGAIKACCTGTLHMVNCTISGNESREAGGGIHARGILIMEHCTITGNRSDRAAATRGGGPRASGIYIDAQTTILSTIVAGNEGQDVHITEDATIVRYATCLVGDGGVEGWLGGDPLLSELGDHGGFTWTHTLLEGSPAIDVVGAGDVAMDQRGVFRPQGEACDLGAVEHVAGGG